MIGWAVSTPAAHTSFLADVGGRYASTVRGWRPDPFRQQG